MLSLTEGIGVRRGTAVRVTSFTALARAVAAAVILGRDPLCPAAVWVVTPGALRWSWVVTAVPCGGRQLRPSPPLTVAQQPSEQDGTQPH